MKLSRKIRRVFRAVASRGRRSEVHVATGSHSPKEGGCPRCGKQVDPNRLALNLYVCPLCGYHHRLGVQERVRTLLDGGQLEYLYHEIQPLNPIDFPNYEEKVRTAQQRSQSDEAITVGKGAIEGRSAIVAIMAFDFLGGSMGSVVGERLARAMLYSAEHELPCIVFSSSGGARMQEGIYSLMQMAKTSHAAALLSESGQPFFVVLTDPTTGGVTASFAMLGDVTLAEPGALIGFAGPRVIEGTIRQKLPEGFQRSEFQQDRGFVDTVVPRAELRSTLAYLIDAHGRGTER